MALINKKVHINEAVAHVNEATHINEVVAHVNERATAAAATPGGWR